MIVPEKEDINHKDVQELSRLHENVETLWNTCDSLYRYIPKESSDKDLSTFLTAMAKTIYDESIDTIEKRVDRTDNALHYYKFLCDYIVGCGDAYRIVFTSNSTTCFLNKRVELCAKRDILKIIGKSFIKQIPKELLRNGKIVYKPIYMGYLLEEGEKE